MSHKLLTSVVGFALLAALALLLSNGLRLLPPPQWPTAAFSATFTDANPLLFHYSFLPRIVVALLAGAGLGLSGWLCQLLLRNPLAEPATLGIASGAQLGFACATLLGAGIMWQQGMTLLGGALCASLVFTLSLRQQFSPITLLLSGVMIGLLCSALQSVLVLFFHEQLQNVFLWSSGSLSQNDWAVARQLWPMLALVLLGTLLMARPLNLLRLSDHMADSMGGDSRRIRLLGLLLVTLLTAWLVNAVGTIGFIGLFAPQFCRLLPHVRFIPHLLLVMVMGALLLLLCDQLALWGERFGYQVTAGNVTAIAGIPFMLAVIAKARFVSMPAIHARQQARRGFQPRKGIAVFLALIIIAALCFALTRHAQGWHISWHDPQGWRWPRVMVAACAGALLAGAGVILQRMTGNPLASPEVLGVNSGAACAVVLTLMLTNTGIGPQLFPAALLGAGVSLLLLMFFIVKSGAQTARMLLAGTLLSAFSGALITFLLASGDPRSIQIVSWLSGSTWRATADSALLGAVIVLLALPLATLLTRWLHILPLGAGQAAALGVPVRLAQAMLLVYCALLSATATLLVGPMSFVGLLAPQLVQRLGIQKPLLLFACASVAGAVLMMLADFLGRFMIWPFQLPAGLLATVLGAPVFIALLNREK